VNVIRVRVRVRARGRVRVNIFDTKKSFNHHFFWPDRSSNPNPNSNPKSKPISNFFYDLSGLRSVGFSNPWLETLTLTLNITLTLTLTLTLT
jgi:hypothetical protein